jgi:hypothetical protein
MDSDFEPLWMFLETHPLGDLKVPEFFLFLKDRQKSFFKKSSTINDEDLFRFLFLELERVIENINTDQNWDAKDQLLDMFMQIIDYYAPVQKQIKKIRNEILKSPTLLKEGHFYGKRAGRYFFHKCHIEKMFIPSNLIPFSDKLKAPSTFEIPSFLHESAFGGLCLYFLYVFQNDDSNDFEKTMASISEALHYIHLKSHA